MSETESDRKCWRRRGRPRVSRTSEGAASPRCYAPQCRQNDEAAAVVLLADELAILNLIDLQGLEQEEAAAVLGVSRRTVWRDLHEARRKVADALVNGKVIEVTGCNRKNEDECPRENPEICPKKDGGLCPRLPDAEKEQDIAI
jgi:predicted DNA-binding protein (UPF0251 family)